MIVAVTGPNGRLGRELIQKHNCVPLNCNITSGEEIAIAIAQTKPDIIINCASKTNVDWCETNVIEAYKVNTFGADNLTALFTGTLVQISTDFIFDGQAGYYDILSLPNPKNTYGFSKLMAETSVRRKPQNLIIRTTILYDAYSNNFATAVIKQLIETGYAKAPKQLYGTPTYIPHLAMGIMVAIEKRLNGTYHIVGKDQVSRFEFAQKLAEKFGFDKNNILDTIAFGDANRPELAGLDTEFSVKAGLPIFTLQQGIDDLYVEFQRNRSTNN